MDVGLRLHGHDLAFDQLEILVFRDDPGVLHAQNLGHREGAAVETLCGARYVSPHVRNSHPPHHSVRRISSTV
jgi:hypothetical protein